MCQKSVSEGLVVWPGLWVCIHSLALSPVSGVPQLVEPVLWDYSADLDVHSKGQYQAAQDVLGACPVTL